MSENQTVSLLPPFIYQLITLKYSYEDVEDSDEEAEDHADIIEGILVPLSFVTLNLTIGAHVDHQGHHHNLNRQTCPQGLIAIHYLKNNAESEKTKFCVNKVIFLFSQ